MLELARRRFAAEGDRVSLRIGDLAHLPLHDGEADFASLNMVLHHVPAPEEVLREIRRILAPGGILVLTDFNRHEDERMRLEYGDHWLGFELETLQAHLTRAGFSVSRSGLARVERDLLPAHHCRGKLERTTGGMNIRTARLLRFPERGVSRILPEPRAQFFTLHQRRTS